MKQQRQSYQQPALKVVSFRIERGFTFSGGDQVGDFEQIQANSSSTTLTGSNFGGGSTSGGDNTNTFGDIF